MNNNPSSKRVGVVFFALRLSYHFSDLIVRMGNFLQLIPDFHFLFELLWDSIVENILYIIEIRLATCDCYLALCKLFFLLC
jgi:hypothetical protein